MKIYFAGSIYGGREDVPIYLEIITQLSKYGQVLTEHVGDAKYVPKSENGIPADICVYTKDTNWMKECDILIAEISKPSLGVGYEIGFAEALGKKIVCLYREGSERPLSCMITGNKNLTVRTYKSFNDIPLILKEFFE